MAMCSSAGNQLRSNGPNDLQPHTPRPKATAVTKTGRTIRRDNGKTQSALESPKTNLVTLFGGHDCLTLPPRDRAYSLCGRCVERGFVVVSLLVPRRRPVGMLPGLPRRAPRYWCMHAAALVVKLVARLF